MLAEEDCSAAGNNQFVIPVNVCFVYMGAREFQVTDKLKEPSELQLELGGKYLCLLSAARSLGREQAYLLVKVFGSSDPSVQESVRLTVEAAGVGMLSVGYSCSKEIICFPASICQKLLSYAERRRFNGVCFSDVYRENYGPCECDPVHLPAVRRSTGAGGKGESPVSPQDVSS